MTSGGRDAISGRQSAIIGDVEERHAIRGFQANLRKKTTTPLIYSRWRCRHRPDV